MKKHLGKIRIGVQLGAGALLVAGGLSNLPVTLLIILVSTVLAGPIFCGWVCPFGTLQDLVSKLTRGIKKRKMPKGIQKGLALTRYVLMAVTTLLTADFVFTLMQYDARINFLSVLEGKVLTLGAYMVLGLYLLVAVFFERPFCNYMCPQGAKYGLFSSLRPFRVVRDSETCVNCGKCDQVCPMNIEIMKYNNVKSLQCINCMSCVSACPKKGALKYGVIKLNRKSGVAYFVAVALILATSTVAMALQFTSSQTELQEAEAQATEALQMEAATNQGTSTAETTSITESDEDQPNEAVSTTTTNGTTASSNGTTQGSQTSSTVPKTTTSSGASSTSGKSNTNTSTSTSTNANTNVTTNGNTNTSTNTTSPTSTQNSTSTTTPATTTTTTNVSKATGAAAGMADGTYTGVADGFRGPMTVAVTVKNEQIVSVEVVDHSDDRKWFNRAVSSVPNWIIDAQSTNVDSVSGATYSSLGIINAAKNALSNGK